MLQIFLCEIARVNKTTLEVNQNILIQVEESGNYELPLKQQDKNEWLIFIPHFNKQEQSKISFHYGYISTIVKQILSTLSTLSKEAFNDFFYKKLHEKEKIGDKVLCTNTYQKVFYNAESEEDFNNSQKMNFTQLPANIVFKHLPEFLI